MSTQVRDERALYRHREKEGKPLSAPATAGKPFPIRLTNVGQEYRISAETPDRKRIWIENRGAGTVFLSPQQSFDSLTGIRLLSGSVFIDESPHVHTGEWWGETDAANTDVVVMEWV